METLVLASLILLVILLAAAIVWISRKPRGAEHASQPGQKEKFGGSSHGGGGHRRGGRGGSYRGGYGGGGGYGIQYGDPYYGIYGYPRPWDAQDEYIWLWNDAHQWLPWRPY
jgi:hypothetical protein